MMEVWFGGTTKKNGLKILTARQRGLLLERETSKEEERDRAREHRREIERREEVRARNLFSTAGAHLLMRWGEPKKARVDLSGRRAWKVPVGQMMKLDKKGELQIEKEECFFENLEGSGILKNENYLISGGEIFPLQDDSSNMSDSANTHLSLVYIGSAAELLRPMKFSITGKGEPDLSLAETDECRAANKSREIAWSEGTKERLRADLKELSGHADLEAWEPCSPRGVGIWRELTGRSPLPTIFIRKSKHPLAGFRNSAVAPKNFRTSLPPIDNPTGEDEERSTCKSRVVALAHQLVKKSDSNCLQGEDPFKLQGGITPHQTAAHLVDIADTVLGRQREIQDSSQAFTSSKMSCAMDRTLPLVQVEGKPPFDAPIYGLVSTSGKSSDNSGDSDSGARDLGASNPGASISESGLGNPSGGVLRDYWEEYEDKVARMRVRPRCGLFTPADEGPSDEALGKFSGKKTTSGSYTDGQELLLSDNWRTRANPSAAAHSSKKKWTGKTIFEVEAKNTDTFSNSDNQDTESGNLESSTDAKANDDNLLRLRPVVRLPSCLNVATPYVRILTGVNGFVQNPLCWDSISARRLAAFGWLPLLRDGSCVTKTSPFTNASHIRINNVDVSLLQWQKNKGIEGPNDLVVNSMKRYTDSASAVHLTEPEPLKSIIGRHVDDFGASGIRNMPEMVKNCGGAGKEICARRQLWKWHQSWERYPIYEESKN